MDNEEKGHDPSMPLPLRAVATEQTTTPAISAQREEAEARAREWRAVHLRTFLAKVSQDYFNHNMRDEKEQQ